MMAGRNDVTTPEGEKVIDQINANIERARSLAEAGNADGLKELGEETESLIASLAGKGSIAIKKEKRDAFSAATLVQPAPKASSEVAEKPKEGTPIKTWDQYAAVVDLVNVGAEKVADGVRQHVKVADLAKEIAAVTFDMWLNLPNKDQLPDLKGNSDQAKKAAGEMYRRAGDGFEHNYDNETALEKLQRSVQTQRTDVRAKWLRSLDADTPEAAEARALFGAALKGKPDGVPYSEFVAKTLYGSPAMLKGEGEKALERYHAKKALESGGSPQAITAEPEGDPDERIRAVVQKLTSDVRKAKPEDFEKASEEVKTEVRKQLDELYQAVKEMIAATL